jgi:hypothetical protein
VIPSNQKIFPNLRPEVVEQLGGEFKLNHKLKSYFSGLFASLCMLIDSNLFQDQLEVDADEIFNKAPNPEQARKDLFDCADSSSQCQCSSAEMKSGGQITGNKYSRACISVKLETGWTSKKGDEKRPVVKINSKFVNEYNNLKFLEIWQNGLDLESDECLARFHDLHELKFMDNALTAIPKSVYKIKSLKTLQVGNNSIQSLENEFADLTRLEKLYLWYANKIVVKGPGLLLPQSLEELRMNEIVLDFIPFDLTSCSQSLQVLEFTGVSLIKVNANTIMTTEQIVSHFNVLSTEKQIMNLIPHFDYDGSGVLENDEITSLNAFIFKKFPRLGLNISKENENVESGVPLSIFFLCNLVELDLSYQAIRFIPDQIAGLKKLKKLNLSNCILLHTISGQVGYLTELEQLSLENCLSLKTPPAEIVNRGFQVVMRYLVRLAAGSVACKKTKLMLVGLGEAGKTSLLNALIRRSEHDAPDITDGINIKEWVVDLPDQTTLTYSMWDFG